MNSKTSLHRQIHPNWIDANNVSSLAFEASVTSQSFSPTPKDENKLSVANGDKLTAEDSYKKHLSHGLKSAGVLSVFGSECETINLKYEEDNNPFDGHSFIDYSSCSGGSEVKRKAKQLKALATSRGWSHKP
jgi:hypothetical protein